MLNEQSTERHAVTNRDRHLTKTKEKRVEATGCPKSTG